jgi:hypothetical protein
VYQGQTRDSWVDTVDQYEPGELSICGDVGHRSRGKDGNAQNLPVASLHGDGLFDMGIGLHKARRLRPEAGQGWTYFWLYIDGIRVNLHHGNCALSIASWLNIDIDLQLPTVLSR